jgi:hypothetical protein
MVGITYSAQHVHEAVGAEGVGIEVDEVRVRVVRLVRHQGDAAGRVLRALLLGAGVALAVWDTQYERK